jgi:hemerythrin-like domain-containing protein
LARARDVVLALDGTVPRDLPELAADCVRFAEAELMPHFEREETLLVPPFAARVGEGDVDLTTMRDQHAELRTLTDVLLEDQGGVSLADRLSAWSKALTGHIRFEERIFFNRVQATLSEAEMGAVGKGLAADSGPACSL